MKYITDEYAKKVFEAICKKHNSTFKLCEMFYSIEKHDPIYYASTEENRFGFRSYDRNRMYWVKIPYTKDKTNVYKKLLLRFFKCLEHGPVYSYINNDIVKIAESKEQLLIEADLLMDN